MSEINIFEYATRNKLRFPYKGLVTVEDLWMLDVKQLDNIFKVLNSKLKSAKEESLLGEKTSLDTDLETQIAIIRYIVTIKQAETTAKLLESERRTKKQKIYELIAEKQDETLKSKSIDELLKMVENL